jgi:hypothetical protein
MRGHLAKIVCLTTVVVGSQVEASPTAPTPAEVCAKLSDADVTTVLGKPAKPQPQDGLNGSGCMWAVGQTMLQVDVETDELLKAKKRDQTASRRFGYMVDEIAAKRAEAVKGVGEQAVWANNILWVLKDKKVFSVSILRLGENKGRATDLALSKTVAAKVLAKL